MGTSLHAAFNLVSGNEYWAIVIFIIGGQKTRFSESSQNSMSEKSIFGHLRSFFSTYKVFPGQVWLIPVSTFKEEYFNEKMSSLAGLKKKVFNFPQKY